MNLLKDADARTFERQLAERLGLNEAIFIGQLHFWLERGNPKQIDGRPWLHKSAKQFTEKDFPWWSTRTVERLIVKLEEQGLVASKPGTTDDQRKWYTINYEHDLLTCVNDSTPRDNLSLPPVNDLTPTDNLSVPPANDLTPTDNLSVPHRQNVGTPTDKLSVPPYKIKEEHKKGSPTKVDDVDTFLVFDRKKELDLVRLNPTHGPTLARFWRKCMSEYGHTNATQPSMKVKDQKMLKEILKLLPEGGERMLMNVLEYYALFVNFAREGYNVNLAAKPQVQKLMLVVDGIAEFDTPAMDDDDFDYSNLGLKGLLDNDDSDADNS
jgi:hypothetical protein